MRSSQRRRIAANRALVESLKTKPCPDCEKQWKPWQMEFDHRAGTVKVGEVSRMISRTRGKLLAEIAKCDVVCANCHKSRTHWRRWHSTTPM